MKKSLLFIGLTFLLLSVSGQTGIYNCNHFEFKSESDPSANRVEFRSNILMVDLDAITNKYFTWRLKSEKNEEDVFLKWNIKRKIDAKYIKEKNIVETIYVARLEILGVEINEDSYIYMIDDLNDKSLNFVIYDPKFKASNCFYNVQKI